MEIQIQKAISQRSAREVLIKKVWEVFKGQPDQNVFVSAATHNAGCEAVVVVGQQYIVFGQYGKKPVLHSCSDTKMLQYPEQIEELRNDS